MTLDPRRARGKKAPSIPQTYVERRSVRLSEEERREILGRLTSDGMAGGESEGEDDEVGKTALELQREAKEQLSSE